MEGTNEILNLQRETELNCLVVYQIHSTKKYEQLYMQLDGLVATTLPYGVSHDNITGSTKNLWTLMFVLFVDILKKRKHLY